MNTNKSCSLLHPYIRVMNASSCDKLDFYMYNTMIAAGMEYGKAGKYTKCERGLTTFRVQSAGDNVKQCANLAIRLETGNVFTICAVGTHEQMRLYAIAEPTERKNLEYGHLRICNLWPESERINVSTKGTCFVGGLRFSDVTRYIEMQPGNYGISIIDANENRPLLEAGEQSVRPGKFNSLYILPPPNENASPTALYTVDAASYEGFYL